MIKYNNKSYKLRNLDISKDNPIIYLKKSDVVERLRKGTEVVLFGNESDLFTRRLFLFYLMSLMNLTVI